MDRQAAFRLGPQQRQDGTRTVETDTSIQDNHQWMSQGSADGVDWVLEWTNAAEGGEESSAKRGPWDHLTCAAAAIINTAYRTETVSVPPALRAPPGQSRPARNAVTVPIPPAYRTSGIVATVVLIMIGTLLQANSAYAGRNNKI
ncbi:uncharacterized protein TRUGW13939_09636 [Talaromyces rugulosus]|uniref:Uncharacterized protein n=1 Tax=Talaromyces rugulosus TaxID=121627 RepID=A0A7H8RAG7_TALRU|nr:uncharacterized protein TRUGW13939_09636 [Talaromyces rugulosus]QKX62475.1 hypothetical protein TRUGW13939_09636 [Talaromyces rugulosus]